MECWLPLAAFPTMHYYPAAAQCNPILPFSSKRSRLPNPVVRGAMATPVGAAGSKVRFARHPPRTKKSGRLVSTLFGECLGDYAPIESTSRRLAEYHPIRFSMLVSDRGAMHATRERYMRIPPPRAALRQLPQKPPDRAA